MFKILFSTAIICFCLTVQAQWEEDQCFNDSIVGKWEGYVTLKFAKTYRVTFEFRKDGTYSSKGGSNCEMPSLLQNENCDESYKPALYFGSDVDDRLKRYKIEKVVNGVGQGTIDLYLPDSLKRDDLKSIKLFADDHETEACAESGGASFLEFELHHPFLESKPDKFSPLKYFLRRGN